jgi:hypothetical protein
LNDINQIHENVAGSNLDAKTQSRYFPCLLFAAVNTAIACLAFPSLRSPVLAVVRGGDSTIMVVNLLIGLAAMAVLAYVLAPVGRAASGSWKANFCLAGWQDHSCGFRR